jgi:hypothetical protein
MKNISELIKENSEMVTEKKERTVNLFIMNCSAVNTMIPEIEKYIYQLNPNNIYAFGYGKVEKVKDIHSFKWTGGHDYDWSKLTKYLEDNCLGHNNFVFAL